MRLGIRAKLVGTLLLAGLLPLALALGVILIGVVELRINSRGHVYRALAQQQAKHLSTILASQVELANLVNHMPGTVEFLNRANQTPPLSQAQIDKVEAAWPKLRTDEGLLKDILSNDVARRWQSVARAQRRFSEVMITDATGRLVAATNKTSDYFQADEEWWQRCFDGGKGRVTITDVIFDESAISPEGVRGTLVADLCLPIYDAPADPVNRKLVGITKISLDATWMLQQVEVATGLEELPKATWLVHSDGRAVSGARPPPVTTLPSRVAHKIATQTAGWTKDDSVKAYELIGFADVEQSRIFERPAQRWHVVVATDVHEVVASVYRLAWLILGLGLTVIAACFVGGLVIARREIIRPVRTLETAVNQLKTGNRDYRLSDERGGGEMFRDDEIGRLAHGFNVMAEQLKEKFEQLEEADELKRQFIDLASHELRTPVTYILGASQLAQRRDGEQPEGGAMMPKISAKAQRLNRIVENMFKLLASDRFARRALRTSEVDVAALIKTVVQEHEPFLRERKQRWEIDLAPDLPRIQADPDKIRDILANLVSNAIRFSPDGGAVGIRAVRSEDGGVEIAVRDSGPGIAPEDLPNLFQPFFTGGGAAVERHSSGEYEHMSRGMGLGLSVVKRFVDLHGGAVVVDTSKEGTTVRVKLPPTTPQAAKTD